MNGGKKEMCVRVQGSSMVNVTMGTEAATRIIKAWEVDSNTEILSDHKYIRIQTDGKDKWNRVSRGIKFPRWNSKKLDKEWFTASVIGGNG